MQTTASAPHARHPSFDAMLRHSAARHKHLCPRQVLGVRMGLAAGVHLALDLPQTGKSLLVIIETDGCFADGIEAATGCSLGHRTLRLEDYGKVAAVFVDVRLGRAVRLAPNPDVRLLAGEYGAEGKNRWERQLLGYQRMPDEALFSFAPVRLIEPLESIISRPGVRGNCARCGEEVINEREVVVDGQPMCRACAGIGYYQPIGNQVVEISLPDISQPLQERIG